ncbi:MFS transporter [Terrarubrum flagellatum]|uniref:MFS transporter n=1 Tax=Terrirubrum flagellatum TaxID=2895980 RepID=UPI0031453F2D
MSSSVCAASRNSNEGVRAGIFDIRRLTIIAIFALHGAIVGSQLSRLAEIQAAIGLAKDQFGIALIGVPAGAICGSRLVGRFLERAGVRLVLLLGIPYFAAALTLLPFAFNTLSLFGCLLLLGLGLSGVNVTMNVEADRIEAATGARLMNRCHAIWAVGFLCASLGGTAAVAAGLSPSMHFVSILLVSVGATVFIVLPMRPSPAREHHGGVKAKRFAAPTIGVLLILGFAVSGIVLEGSSRNWSIIYLRDDFAASDWVATLALPSFVMWQMIGRFAADGLIDRFGPVAVARALAALSLLGLAMVAMAHSIALALIGFAFIGFGVSTTHPQAISAAAQLGDRPSSLNVAALSTAQIAIGFFAPPAFGLIAAGVGIRLSFLLIAPLPIIAIFFARYLAPARRP